MENYLKFVRKYAKSILWGLAAITVFFAVQLSGLTMDSNPYLLPNDHPARKTIADMQKEFTGTYDAVLLAIYNEEGVFNPESLAAIHHLTRESRKLIFIDDSDVETLGEIRSSLAAEPRAAELIDEILKDGLSQNDVFAARELEGLAYSLPLSTVERKFLGYLPGRLSPIEEMAGMAATENILLKDGALDVRITLNDPNRDPGDVRREIMGNRQFINGVVSSDEKTGVVVVEINTKQDDAAGQLRAYEAFQKMLEDYRREHPEFTDDVHIAGVPIFMAEQKKIMDRDLTVLFPAVVLLVTLILAFFFRRAGGVLIPMVNVLMCTVWTLGAMALFNVPMDLITSVLPVFLITICSSDAIHTMFEFYDQKTRISDNSKAVDLTMRMMVSPVILTTLTTCVTYMLATKTKISSIQSFGLFISFGMFAALVISLLMIPSWLHLSGNGTPAAKPSLPSEKSDPVGFCLEKFFGAVIRNRGLSALLFLVAFAGAVHFALQVKVEDSGSEYFSEDNKFRQADEFVNKHIAGTSPGWISFESDSSGGPAGILKTEYIQFLDDLDKFLLAQEEVAYTYSLAAYVKRMNLVLNDMDPAQERIPSKVEIVKSIDSDTGEELVEEVSGDEIIRQCVLMFENGGGSDLTNVLNSDFSKTITMFTMNTGKASRYKELLNSLAAWTEANKPKELVMKVGGTPVIWTGVLSEILAGQISSFALAFTSVLVMMMFWFRSAKLGFIGSLPLIVTVAFYYAVMALADIELNVGTALISYLVVGIVDYSAHYIARIKHHLSLGDDVDEALMKSIAHSGKSIFINVIVFSFGFVALLFSVFKPVVHLGSLVSLSLLISGFLSLFLITLLAPIFISSEAVGEEIAKEFKGRSANGKMIENEKAAAAA